MGVTTHRLLSCDTGISRRQLPITSGKAFYAINNRVRQSLLRDAMPIVATATHLVSMSTHCKT
ncbi:MAG: hypothetical protein ACJAXZ_003260 [Akkermansiaceae bacterium]|jgi:hypothetical protein